MTEIEIIKRDIQTLLEANQLDWHALLSSGLSRQEREAIKAAITDRNVRLFPELFNRLDAAREEEG